MHLVPWLWHPASLGLPPARCSPSSTRQPSVPTSQPSFRRAGSLETAALDSDDSWTGPTPPFPTPTSFGPPTSICAGNLHLQLRPYLYLSLASSGVACCW
ncbi:hypothetical protein HDV57DRAFT_482743 [Trichoderma longibrachiatum]